MASENAVILDLLVQLKADVDKESGKGTKKFVEDIQKAIDDATDAFKKGAESLDTKIFEDKILGALNSLKGAKAESFGLNVEELITKFSLAVQDARIKQADEDIKLANKQEDAAKAIKSGLKSISDDQQQSTEDTKKWSERFREAIESVSGNKSLKNVADSFITLSGDINRTNIGSFINRFKDLNLLLKGVEGSAKKTFESLLSEKTPELAKKSAKALIPGLSSDDVAESRAAINQLRQLLQILGDSSRTVFTTLGSSFEPFRAVLGVVNTELTKSSNDVTRLANEYISGKITLEQFNASLNSQEIALEKAAGPLKAGQTLINNLTEAVQKSSDKNKAYADKTQIEFKAVTDAISTTENAVKALKELQSSAITSNIAQSGDIAHYKEYIETLRLAEDELKKLAELHGRIKEFDPTTKNAAAIGAYERDNAALQKSVKLLTQYQEKLTGFKPSDAVSVEIDNQQKALRELITSISSRNLGAFGESLVAGLSQAIIKLDELKVRVPALGTEIAEIATKIPSAFNKVVGDLGAEVANTLKKELAKAAAATEFTIPPLKLGNIAAGEATRVNSAFGEIEVVVASLRHQWEAFVKYVESNQDIPGFVELRQNLPQLRDIVAQLTGSFATITAKSTDFGKEFNSTSNAAISNLNAVERLYTILGVAFSDASKNADAFTLVQGEATNATSATLKAVNQLKTSLIETAAARTQVASLSEGITTVGSSVLNLEAKIRFLTTHFESLTGSASKVSASHLGLDKVQNDIKATTDKLDQFRTVLVNLFEIDKDKNLFTPEIRNQIMSLREQVDYFLAGLSRSGARLQEVSKIHVDLNLDQANAQYKKLVETVTEGVGRISSSFRQSGQSINAEVSSILGNLLDKISKNQGSAGNLSNLQKQVAQFLNLISQESSTKSFAENLRLIGDVKEAVSGIQSLIKTYRDYYEAKLESTRLSLIQAELTAKDIKLSDEERSAAARTAQVLRTKAIGISNVIDRLQKYSTALEETGKSAKNFETLQNLLDKSSQAKERVSAGIRDDDSIARRIQLAKELDEAVEKNVASNNRLIAKFRELGGPVAAEEIAKLEEMNQKQIQLQQSTENVVKPYQQLEQALTQVIQKTSNGTRSFDEWSKSLGNNDSSLTQSVSVTNLFFNALEKLQGEFNQLREGATDFSALQTVYEGHKAKVNELSRSLQSLMQTLQLLGVETKINLGSGVSATAGDLINTLRNVYKEITGEASMIRTALQAGGSTLDDFLPSGDKLTTLESKIKSVFELVAKANKDIQALSQGATEEGVAKVKEQIGVLVKERSEIIKDLDSGIKRLQDAQAKMISDVSGTSSSPELTKQINDAIVKLNELKSLMGTADFGAGFAKRFGDLKDSVAPVLQLAEAMAKATTQMNLSSDSNTLFGSSLQHINTLLKESQENLGRTRTTLEEKPKEELKGYMDTLNLRVRELMKSFNELHQVVNLAQGANPSLINPESIEAAKIQLVALRAELERTRAAQTQLKEVMDRSINSSGLMAAFPNIAHNIHEVRDAGALLSKGLMSVFELVAKQNISRLGDGADAARARMRELATEMRKLEDVVVSSLRTMDQWSMGLQMAGQSMMQPFKEAVSSFVKFEDSLAIVKGILNVTSSQMEELTNKTIMLGMTTRHSAGEAADAVKQLAYAGYTTAQQMQLLPTVMNLATAAELNLSEATKIAMQVMSSQRLPIDQVAHGVDILALAANRTTATLAEVGEGFKYIGALSGTVGNKIEDTASAIALLHNAGMRGSMAGTALRGSMQALLNPTTQEAAVLKQVSDRLGGLGLQILDSSGKFVGYQRIIEQFEKAGVNTSEILEMFGQRAGPGMAALLQMGSAKLRDLKDDLENADGVTAHIAQTLEETLGGRLQIMANNFAAFGESVGRNLSGSLGFLADAATFVVRKFMVMREQLGPLTVILDNFAALVASVVLGLGTLAIAFTMSMVPVGQFMSFLKTVGVLLFKGSSALVLYAVEMGTVAKTSAAAIGAASATAAIRTTEAAMTTEAAAVRMAASWKAAAGAAGGFHGVLQIIIAAGRALLFTPIGLLITGLTVAVGLWFAFAKNTTAANEELDKQRDMLINTGKEYDSLGTRIIKVGEVMQSLRVGHIGLDESKFMDLGSVEEQKQKLMGLMQTFVDRVKEGSDQFKKAFAVDVVLNKTTGELEGFKLISTETGGVLGELSTEMLKNANAAEVMSGEVHKLNSALQEVENKEIENISQEKMKNIVKTFHSFLTDHVQEAYPLESLEKQYNELVKKKSDYYKKLSELDKEKASTDSNFRRASIELEKEYIAAEIAGLNSEIESVGKYKEQALKSEKFLEGGIKQLIVEAIKELNTKKLPITVDNILLEIKPILKMSGMSDSTIENFFDKRIRGIYEAMQKASSSAANDLDLTAGLEKAFRGMQNYVDSMAKLLDKQIKDLKTNMDDNKKLLDVYDQIAKQYTKVRQTIVAAYQTEYKGESAEIARQLEVDLNQIQEVGMRTYTGLGNNSIAYMQKSKDSDRMGFESFAEFQGKKIDVSKYTNEQMYSLFKNSLTKQIDDLERKDKVTENVYSIPVRLQVEQGFGMKTINTFVADAKRSTGELLTYTKTFDNELVQAHLDMETRKLDLTLNANKKEEENLNKLYKEKIFPLYKVGTEDWLKVEEEYTTKKIALEEKGYKATEKTIQEIYKQHKQLDDKLHQLDSDRANFHNKIDQDRRKLEDSQLNDVQKLEDSKRRIRNLTEQAGLAANEGNLDRSKALYEKALAEMDKMKVEPFDQDSMNFQKRYFEQLETGYDSVADRMKSAGESEKKLLLDTAVKLEDTLASFDANLKELAKTLKSLAEAMTALTKSDAKLGGVDVDNADALHKINAITEAMRQARLEFEKPMRIEVSEKEALEEIGKLGKEYADSNKQYQQAERTKAAASKIKQEYDEAEKLLAVYHALKETVTALTIPDTKGKVVAGEMLEGVDKKDSDAAKKYAEINEYIKQRLELIKNLEVAYQQAGKEVPKEIQQRKELLELAKQQMTPDSKGNILVTQDIDKALKGVIAGTDEYKSLMLDTLQKERLLRERIKRVTIEQAQAIADLNKEIQKNKDQGADPNIARQSVTNPSQGVGELRNQLENLKKLLKDFPELQPAYDAVKKAIDSATEGYKSQTEEIEKNTDAVKKNAEASKASENTTSTKKESVQQQANEFAAGWKAEADAINEKQKIVEQEKQQEKDHEDYLRSRAAGMTEDQKLNDQQKQQEENLLTFMQDTANQKQQLADSQKSANAQSAQNAQKLDGYKQRIEALQAERAEIEKNIAADQKREAQDKVAGTYDKTRSFGYDLADQGKLAQNTAELEKLKADMQDYLAASQAAAANSPELQVKTDTSQVQEGISWIEKVLGYNGKTVEVQVLMKAMLDNNGTNRGFQLGGLIQHFAEGGLAQIQRLASGGQSLFRRITNMVPGVGKGDTVPAMLEPGEYVIRGDAVKKYGVNFLELVNRGMLQFKALGGSMMELPSLAASSLSGLIMPNFNMPSEGALAGGHGDMMTINWQIGNKTFPVKSARSQVSDMVNAIKQLDRGY